MKESLPNDDTEALDGKAIVMVSHLLKEEPVVTVSEEDAVAAEKIKNLCRDLIQKTLMDDHPYPLEPKKTLFTYGR